MGLTETEVLVSSTSTADADTNLLLLHGVERWRRWMRWPEQTR